MSTQGILTTESFVSIGRNLVSSPLAGEVVILNLESGIYHGLEAVGARVWELIVDPAAVRTVRDAILEEYDVEMERCERELLALLEELKSHDLLEVRSAATG